jgi:acylphosphatase
MSGIPMPKERRRVYYSGQVQGVGFRYTTLHLAEGLAVTGYVRNLDDGRVELLAEGDPAELDRFLEAIDDRFGGNATEIRMERLDGEPAYQDFSIRWD